MCVPTPPWSPRADGCAASRSRSRASKPSTRATSTIMEPDMRREGSPWRGVGAVFLKELSDHLTGARMLVLEWLVVLTAVASVYVSIQQIKNTSAEDPFLFLRLFT